LAARSGAIFRQGRLTVPTAKTILLNQKTNTASLAPDVLALVHIGSTLTDAMFGKIALIADVRANWHMKFGDAQFPLDKIMLQIGYPDSQGIMSYRSSGTVVDGGKSNLIKPLIWTETNQQEIFQTAFLKGASDSVVVRYQVLFNISPVLPPGFNDQCSATEKLHLGTQTQDFTLKVFFQ
jgi:hypothetical protein